MVHFLNHENVAYAKAQSRLDAHKNGAADKFLCFCLVSVPFKPIILYGFTAHFVLHCLFVRPRSHGHFFSGKVGLSRKISSCKLNSVAKFLCQISVTKLSVLSRKSNLCCL